MRTGTKGALVGAAFLMATSAIGPGFLTQTAVFTERLGPSFAFAILVSVVIDLVAQLNIWRVLTLSGRRAPEVANAVAPGLGTLLAVLVALGGLAFNIGNVAGAGLGLQAAFGLPVTTGAVLSGALAIGLFFFKEAGKAMDRFTVALGFVLVGLTAYVAISAAPPVGEAVVRAFAPTQLDVFAIVTIVGGTVGGYITFAGAHRLVDAGVHGAEAQPEVRRSAITAIGVASLMRAVLFLAALGVVSQGFALDPANPPGSVFRHATGEFGFKLFGVVMWAAAITSVVGAAYTSVSFLRGLHPLIEQRWPVVVALFISVSAGSFVLIGQPVKTLVLVGSLNGLILPLALGAMLVAAHRPAIVGTQPHPKWLTVAGVLVTVAMAAAGAWVIYRNLPSLLS
jgi:Mn2+/Fe2+ NRAMP family transporter